MPRPVLFSATVAFAVLMAVEPLLAQGRTPGRRQRAAAANAKSPQLPDDERLLSLHREFVKKAEKLATEYEHKQQLDKALDVYNEILKLVPQYQPARAKRDALFNKYVMKSKFTFTVAADKDWQNTGITTVPGKLLMLRATGTWTFNLSAPLGPDGMQIPKELRAFNLGSLIGVIDTGNPKEMKPFIVGSQLNFVPRQRGKLYLRMYDTDPSDNKGSLKVDIMGSYQK